MKTSISPGINLAYLDLMSDGDDFMKKTMLDMLIEEMPPELVKLRNAYLANDCESLHQVAHKMKSTLAFIGNPVMDEANGNCERIGREGTDIQRAAQHIQTLESQAELVMPLLKDESARLA